MKKEHRKELMKKYITACCAGIITGAFISVFNLMTSFSVCLKLLVLVTFIILGWIILAMLWDIFKLGKP